MTVPSTTSAQANLPYCIGFDAEAAKVASLELLQHEGVALRLHSWVVAPMMEGSRVTGIIVESKSGRQAIAADIVIDATGDGDVAARAGAPFMGPADKGDRMGMSLMYQLGGISAAAGDAQGGIRIGDRVVRWGPGFGGDGLDVENLTRAEVETRLQLWQQVQALRKRPGSESVYLAQTATGIGVRETRRILGEYLLTEQDAIRGTRFPDVIAISSNPMPSYHGRRFFFNHEGFDIPYRSLVPQKIDGLVLTGRCISCEQAPFQSARSMAPAMADGTCLGLCRGIGRQSWSASAKAQRQGDPKTACRTEGRTPYQRILIIVAVKESPSVRSRQRHGGRPVCGGDGHGLRGTRLPAAQAGARDDESCPGIQLTTARKAGDLLTVTPLE